MSDTQPFSDFVDRQNLLVLLLFFIQDTRVFQRCLNAVERFLVRAAEGVQMHPAGHPAELMSATEIISDGPEGIILESVLEGYAEYYSADLSEKVIRGMTKNARKGKFTGGAIPFGYIINADHRGS